MLKKKVKTLLKRVSKERRKIIHEMFWGDAGIWDRFSLSPASTKYHDSEEGGLLKHTLEVTDAMLKLNEAMNLNLDEESIIICGLFHDLGKIGSETQAMYLPNKGPGYSFNTVVGKLPHSLWSTFILQEFGIVLSEDEYQAIIFHNGRYTSMGDEIRNHETTLQWLLHTCDVFVIRK